MTIRTIFFEAQRLIGARLQREPEEREVLLCAASALFFIADTGQHYRFEDYRKSPTPAPTPSARDTGIEEFKRKVEALFIQFRSNMPSPEERELASAVLDALNFIASSGQYAAWEEFRNSARGGPPRALTSFSTLQEAEEWLNNQAEPPSQGYVLVANEYFQFYYFRESDQRGLRQAFL